MEDKKSTVKVQRHQITHKAGFIYCVYDGAVEGTISQRHVKCGKTTSGDPVAYCIRTYGRHMGKVTISNLAAVSDTTLSELLLFRILDNYRVVQRREIFAVPDVRVVEEAFSDLVDVIRVMNKKNPKLTAELIATPTIMFVEPNNNEGKKLKALFKKEEATVLKDEAKMRQVVLRELVRQHIKGQKRKEIEEFIRDCLIYTGVDDDVITQTDVYSGYKKVYKRLAPSEQKKTCCLGKRNFFDIFDDLVGCGIGQYNAYVGWIMFVYMNSESLSS